MSDWRIGPPRPTPESLAAINAAEKAAENHRKNKRAKQARKTHRRKKK